MCVFFTIQASKIKASLSFLIIGLISILLLNTVSANESSEQVALIAARGSGIEEMSIRDVRRLYLGLKSVDSVSVKKPVLNVRSKALYDDFLKNTMHMTEGSYKRKLVKRLFRQGGETIPEMSSLKELNVHLLENIGDISFIEVSSLLSMDDIEVIQILW